LDFVQKYFPNLNFHSPKKELSFSLFISQPFYLPARGRKDY